MTTVHKNMSDAQRHEPKGASTAALGTIWVSDGAGSGAFTDVLGTIKNKNYVALFGRFDDISTASSIFIPNPILGNIVRIIVTLQTAITTANSTVTAEINGVLVTGSSLTITQAGSAGGSTFSVTPSGANTVAAGSAVEIITDGASSTTAPAIVCVLMDVS